MTSKELEAYYHKWDYKYKPSIQKFFNYIPVFNDRDSFIQKLENARCKAYYSQSQTIASHGFNELACLIYFAIINNMETPYDHIIKGKYDFEYKLNHLHEQDNEQRQADSRI